MCGVRAVRSTPESNLSSPRFVSAALQNVTCHIPMCL